MKIGIGQVSISERQRELVNTALTNNRLSPGPFVRKYESLLGGLFGLKHAISMASGTCALQVSLEAMKEKHGWSAGAEVIVPATTFIATVSSVLHAGLTPVLCDVESESGNIDIDLFADRGWKNVVAILPVHLLGRAADMNRIVERSRQAGVSIIEDCCESVGVSHNGKSVGSFGSAGVISTYVCHHVSTGVGGAIVTDDDDLSIICRSLMQHGRDPDYLWLEDDDNLDDSQIAGMMRARYHFPRWGYSYRATEMEAALGVGALENSDDVRRDRLMRRSVAQQIVSALLPWSERIAIQYWTPECNPLFYPLICNTPETCQGLSEAYERDGIETRPMFPLLTQPPILKMLADQGREPADYPNALKLCKTAFMIACHSGIGSAEIEHIRVTTERYFSGEER